MSHETSKSIERDGKHYVINTAGFSSIKNAENAAFNKKNLKYVPPKAYASKKLADAASKRRSAKTEAIALENSRRSGLLREGPLRGY